MIEIVSQNSVSHLSTCPICGGRDFNHKHVLWKELITEWQLSDAEAHYIDRQQGYCCEKCGANLRSMALANAIVRSYGYRGTLIEFCADSTNAALSVLEINMAGTLTNYLKAMPGHRLISYPEYDMTKLNIGAAEYDLIIHSDTLEHVNYPVVAMSECLRVLKQGGRCIFTIPIVVGRFSRSRVGLKNSYHGYVGDESPDLLVHTEFGADFWVTVMSAGFNSCSIYSLEYPAGLAIEARN